MHKFLNAITLDKRYVIFYIVLKIQLQICSAM